MYLGFFKFKIIKDCKGITLAEVIATLAILCLLLTLCFRLFSLVIHVHNDINAKTIATHRLNSSILKLKTLLSSSDDIYLVEFENTSFDDDIESGDKHFLFADNSALRILSSDKTTTLYEFDTDISFSAEIRDGLLRLSLSASNRSVTAYLNIQTAQNNTGAFNCIQFSTTTYLQP